MKLFTFSGIGATFRDLNDGAGLVEFAEKVRGAMGPAGIDYHGEPDVDHFVSYVNFTVLFGDPFGVVSLSGNAQLNAEADRLAPVYGKAVLDWMDGPGAGDKTMLVLAHSQGTNNFVTTWNWLLENAATKMKARATRAVLFDPKVCVTRVEQLLGYDPDRAFLDVLFFQSELNLLGNQTLGWGGRFIDQFPVGNHLWVRGLDHGQIVDWRKMSRPREMMTQPEYLRFRHEYTKAAVRRRPGRGRHRLNKRNAALARFTKKYPMKKAAPAKIVTAFLNGRLPGKFAS